MAIATCIFGYVSARAHHHVCPVCQQRIDHARRGGRIIRPVAIGHHINIGFNIREHLAHDIAFALSARRYDGGACKGGLG